ncbi:uncharacterized protein G2W53_004947 [Senna tora]|uniref:Uncharacterized protein n=1 Tax=Senna tora TaxID=362788 RepID=A0A834XCM9_9FABA|nr:uncharacterized protein G2W53_004947 [Senna tora]
MKLLQREKRIEPYPHSPNNALKLHGSKSVSPKAVEKPAHSNPASQKKTRDLPNLTECHACHFKVDVCTGRNRLHILPSEWRIVLLCKSCLQSVKSSQICSYCFSNASADCFRCGQCQRSVHKKCFSEYKGAAPWSYACSGSEFSVCVDCWIPKSVSVSRRIMKSRKVRKKSGVVSEKETSRVFDNGNSTTSLEDVVRDANLVVEKKVEAATKAREEAVKKAAVARRAIEMANSALSLIVKRDEDSLNEGFKMDADKVVDDSELGLELYSPMNSSPNSCCLLNSGYLGTPKLWTSSVDSPCKRSNPSNSSGFGKHEMFNDDKIYKESHKHVFEPSVCMDKSDIRTCSREGKCIADCDAKEETGEELMKEGEGSCSNRLINLGGEDSGMNLDGKQEDTVLHKEDRCNGRPDRYFLKYRRRVCRSKPISDSKPKILYSENEINTESQGSAPEIFSAVETYNFSNSHVADFILNTSWMTLENIQEVLGKNIILIKKLYHSCHLDSFSFRSSVLMLDSSIIMLKHIEVCLASPKTRLKLFTVGATVEEVKSDRMRLGLTASLFDLTKYAVEV